jgi:hypothetical protein
MPQIAHSAHDMISGMTPRLQPGAYVFVTTDDADKIALLAAKAISTFREAEGFSMLLPLAVAETSNLNTDQPMCWITLDVYSALEGVGLTAAVASALGAVSIPCNMVAAYHHDHVFVPLQMGEQALQVLLSLQRAAAREA